jgi:uncharacterized protein YndB with AHSA1/START domain
VAASNRQPAKGPAFSPKGELVLTRIFDAPRELVFKVWADPKHVARWWGPNGFTTTIHEMEVRPGGPWRYSMRAPDGHNYPFNGEYVEVVALERLVFVGTIHEQHEHKVWTEILFADVDNKTKITVHQIYSFESDATRGAPVGWNQQLDRLKNYLVAI